MGNSTEEEFLKIGSSFTYQFCSGTWRSLPIPLEGKHRCGSQFLFFHPFLDSSRRNICPEASATVHGNREFLSASAMIISANIELKQWSCENTCMCNFWIASNKSLLLSSNFLQAGVRNYFKEKKAHWVLLHNSPGNTPRKKPKTTKRIWVFQLLFKFCHFWFAPQEWEGMLWLQRM